MQRRTNSSSLKNFIAGLFSRRTRLSEDQIIDEIFNILKRLDSPQNQGTMQTWQAAIDSIVRLLVANGRNIANIDYPSVDYTSFTVESLAQHMQRLELPDTPTTLLQLLCPCLDCSCPMPKPLLHRTTALGAIVDNEGAPLTLTMRALEKLTQHPTSRKPKKTVPEQHTPDLEPIPSAEVKPSPEKETPRIVTEQPAALKMPSSSGGSPVSVVSYPST